MITSQDTHELLRLIDSRVGQAIAQERKCASPHVFNKVNSSSVKLFGTTSSANPLTAEVQVSLQSNNSLVLLPDGLFASTANIVDSDVLAIVENALAPNQFAVTDGIISLLTIPFVNIDGVPDFILAETDPIFSASAAAQITLQDIANWNSVDAGFYGQDGVLTNNRTVYMDGKSLTFENSGLFRIEEGDINFGGIYDFNNGIDFSNYDGTKSLNFSQSILGGFDISYNDLASQTTTSFQLREDFVEIVNNGDTYFKIANYDSQVAGYVLSLVDPTTGEVGWVAAGSGGGGGGAVTSVAGKTGVVTLNRGDVGLSNVDNTSDINKPISTLQQAAIDGREPSVAGGTTSQYYRGDKTWVTLDRTAVGLSNVDNTNDLAKPVSTLQQTAINGREPTVTAGTIGDYYRGDKTWASLNKAAVGLSAVDNTSDINKPVSTLQASAINARQAQLSGTGLVRVTGTTISYDSNTYATSSDLSTAIATRVPTSRVISINGQSFDLSADSTYTVALPTPGGNNNNIQYNSSSAFAGSDNFKYDGSLFTNLSRTFLSDGIDIGVNSADANTALALQSSKTSLLGLYGTSAVLKLLLTQAGNLAIGGTVQGTYGLTVNDPSDYTTLVLKAGNPLLKFFPVGIAGGINNGAEMYQTNAGNFLMNVNSSTSGFTIMANGLFTVPNAFKNSSLAGATVRSATIAADGTLGVGAESGTVAVTPVSNNYTILNSDNVILVNASGGPVTLTVPASVSIGKSFRIKKVDATSNVVTVSGGTFDGDSSLIFPFQYNSAILYASAATTYSIF